ncbi:FHA domain-containing protein [Bacteroides sp. AN502(2024)]|uniref:FHA domain-containing protein n=1 Tax=Bacteroides sp. AN502(2024) TaxID=3160599 RepID=UPI003519220F
MEIIVGRKGQQSVAITDLSVSREHCKLTSNSDGTYTLENLSVNGTFVDGKSIVRTQVTVNTEIRLGSSFIVRVRDLLPSPVSVPSGHSSQAATLSSIEKEYQEKFRKLKAVYDRYSADKIAIQKEAGINNFYRMLPMTLMSLVGLTAAVLPGLGNFAPVVGTAGIVLLIYSLAKSYKGSKENPEKMEALNKQFMIDYVCPKCGNFLGFVPYETLANKSVCSFCKCKWT